MRATTKVLSMLAATGLVGVLAGCSMDTLIWGPEGARVIDTTNHVIEAAASGTGADHACPDGVADFGAPDDWDGLAAGEPESFDAHRWSTQAPLHPSWSINLEFAGAGEAPGTRVPGDVFYQRDGDGYCVVDVAWSTVLG